MPKADMEYTHPRRKFLGHIVGGAAVVAVAAGAASLAQAVQPENADAELIALCAQLDDLERHGLEMYDAYNSKVQDPPDEALAPIRDEQAEIVERITQMRATTTEGFIALANTIVLVSPELIDNPGGFVDDVLAMLLRDLSAVGAAGGVS
jgi:hypothetical protein